MTFTIDWIHMAPLLSINNWMANRMALKRRHSFVFESLHLADVYSRTLMWREYEKGIKQFHCVNCESLLKGLISGSLVSVWWLQFIEGQTNYVGNTVISVQHFSSVWFSCNLHIWSRLVFGIVQTFFSLKMKALKDESYCWSYMELVIIVPTLDVAGSCKHWSFCSFIELPFNDFSNWKALNAIKALKIILLPIWMYSIWELLVFVSFYTSDNNYWFIFININY